MKKRILNSIYAMLLSGALIALIAGCYPKMSAYDARSYNETMAIRDHVSVLMNKATENYSLHEMEVLEVKKEIEMMYAYEKTKTNNEYTVQQWDIVKAPKGSLYSFFDEWKQKKTLSPFYVSEMSGIIRKIFDTLLELESKKRKT